MRVKMKRPMSKPSMAWNGRELVQSSKDVVVGYIRSTVALVTIISYYLFGIEHDSLEMKN